MAESDSSSGKTELEGWEVEFIAKEFGSGALELGT